MIEVLEPRRLLTAATAIGSESQVNTYTNGDQLAPVVAMDSTGDYVSAWQSAGQDGSGFGIFAQRFNSTGTAQGPEFQVNTYTIGDQTLPTVAMDSAGDFVVAWVSAGQDGSGAGVFAQRYNSSGVAQGSEFQVNTYTKSDQTTPSVAMDATGDFVVVWDSEGQSHNAYASSIGDYAIYAQRYNSAGVTQGSEFKVNTSTRSAEFNPSVAMDAAGDFVVTWKSHDFDNFSDPFPHIAAKRFNSSGATVQDEFLVQTGSPHGQNNPEVAMDPTGNFVITYWGYYDDPLKDGVQAQLYNSAGVSQNGFVVNTFTTGNQNNSRTAYSENGDFVITWQSNSNVGIHDYSQDGSGYGVYAQEFDPSGRHIGSETRVNSYTPGDQMAPAVALDAAGDYVVVWQSAGQDGSGFGVYSQQFLTSTAPLLLQIEGTTLSVVGALSTPVTTSLNVYDGINNNWVGATVAITNNYQNGQDVLSFINTSTITGTWNAANGTLTLSGTDSVSNYRAALRSVLYHNTSATPNTALTRTITFQTSAGVTSSNTVSRNVSVRTASYPPTLTGLSPSGFYLQGTPSLAMASTLVVTEPDGLNIQTATVSFVNWQNGDRLAFYNSYALQHTFTEDLVANTATLTITGSDTAAHYQTTLQSLLFWNVAGEPNSAITRVATIMVSDQYNSASATENLNVYQYLSGLSATANYLQGSVPLTLAPNLVVTPPAGVTTITSATVSFTNWQGEDRLAFYNSLALQHTFSQDLVAHTAVLTITGNATPAGYQTLLQSVTYQDVAGQPITSITRVATFVVNDGTNTGSATQNVTVTATNQPPLVQVNSTTALTYKVNSAPIAIMGMALVSDPDSNNLTSLTVQITSGYQSGHDILSFVNQLGITGSFNSTTGLLTLSGSSYVGNYRQALRSVMYNTTGTGVSITTRVFTVIAIDDTYISGSPVTNSVTVTP